MSAEAPPTPAAVRRRTQIVHATINVIAELGYQRCSFAEIAAHGGLSSTRLISYHFADRAALMREVATRIVADMAASVTEAMQRTTSPRDAVHAYIRANVAFADQHRAEAVTLVALLFAGALPTDERGVDATQMTIADLIRAGVGAGEFSGVDPVIAADVLQRTAEGVLLRLYRTPGMDLTTLGDDLVAFLDSGLGTAHPGTSDPGSPS
ncbi:TetR/AcrR family transcriptional regulator [Curtobacterium sp. VKM Ac-2922]|uniref:TetR/AcrR family transcriptional regulator n=1 Tax=Curtobacterium sp. VKM Ac-2922 TaxID=2929475 RepID=UPI001FB201E4|nr:TetR/AcrR family transcriptional regulator [Curtobacterium sp. VKM Ac-2922]MCJ1715123.1 TetR/AcrR family transcriptional regulator [Curtobacterium sp. VKM Ac-2922]